ncbi:hypothetical protein LY76DRAFT_242216 [Colletotrichum caudatum]|nr:hypothetical protein LY76DRAFT_242216 [Colletotrichum caudatum]
MQKSPGKFQKEARSHLICHETCPKAPLWTAPPSPFISRCRKLQTGRRKANQPVENIEQKPRKFRVSEQTAAVSTGLSPSLPTRVFNMASRSHIQSIHAQSTSHPGPSHISQPRVFPSKSGSGHMSSLASASTACINMHFYVTICAHPPSSGAPFHSTCSSNHFVANLRSLPLSPPPSPPSSPLPSPLGPPPSCPTDLVPHSRPLSAWLGLASLLPLTRPQSSITLDALTALSLTFFHCLVPFSAQRVPLSFFLPLVF